MQTSENQLHSMKIYISPGRFNVIPPMNKTCLICLYNNIYKHSKYQAEQTIDFCCSMRINKSARNLVHGQALCFVCVWGPKRAHHAWFNNWILPVVCACVQYWKPKSHQAEQNNDLLQAVHRKITPRCLVQGQGMFCMCLWFKTRKFSVSQQMHITCLKCLCNNI